MMRFFLLITAFFSTVALFAQPAENNMLSAKEDAAAKVRDRVLIRMTASKNICYTGEPVVITSKYYTQLRTDLNITHYPSCGGFSIIDMNVGEQATIEKINGQEYRVYTVQKVQGYALQPGNLVVEPIEADNTAYFVRKEWYDANPSGWEEWKDRSPENWPSEAVVAYRFTLKSEPLTIQVLPLPDAGRPDSFRGAAGRFSISSFTPNTTIEAGEKAEFLVELKGEGNLQLINPPIPNWPKGIEFFEPIVNEQLNKYIVPVSGFKQFRFPFVVADSGTYELPPVSFSYFDIGEKKYKSISTQPIKIKAKPSAAKPELVIYDPAPVKGKLAGFFNQRVFVVITVALLILTGLAVWLMNERKKDKKRKSLEETQKQLQQQQQLENEKLFALAKNPLEKTQQYLADSRATAFYRSLDDEYRSYLSKVLKVPAHQLSNTLIQEQLDKCGFETTTVKKVLEVLQNTSVALYTPTASERDMYGLYDLAMLTVEELRRKIL